LCEVQVSSKGPLDFMGSRNTEGIFMCIRTVGEREKLRQGQPRAERERGCEATRRARVRGRGHEPHRVHVGDRPAHQHRSWGNGDGPNQGAADIYG